jgi:hypothetical protein
MAAPADLVEFSRVAEVPLYYARDPVAKYGTRGKGPRSCRLRRQTLSTLTACLEELWQVCPWGRAEVLTEAGCYVDGKGPPHDLGRAIDIDAIWWRSVGCMVARDAPLFPRRYLAIESTLRRYFGITLGWWFNARHHDHWHCDDTRPVGFNSTESAEVKYLQASLGHVWNRLVDIDGVLGPQTLAALELVLEGQGLPLITELAGWKGYLWATSKAGWIC